MAQAIHWHDARVLQAAGDLGFEEEPLARLLFAGITLLVHIERHLAVQFSVERHGDDAETASRVRPQNAKPAARSRRAAYVREG
jgi:hypothetical protein